MTSVYLTIWGWVTNTLLKLALSTAPSHAVHFSHQWITVNYSITACMVTNVTILPLLSHKSKTCRSYWVKLLAHFVGAQTNWRCAQNDCNMPWSGSDHTAPKPFVACSRTPQWRYRDRYRCEVCSSIERLRSLMHNIRECEDIVHDICLPHNMRVSHQYTPEASTEYSTVTCSAS